MPRVSRNRGQQQAASEHEDDRSFARQCHRSRSVTRRRVSGLRSHHRDAEEVQHGCLREILQPACAIGLSHDIRCVIVFCGAPGANQHGHARLSTMDRVDRGERIGETGATRNRRDADPAGRTRIAVSHRDCLVFVTRRVVGDTARGSCDDKRRGVLAHHAEDALNTRCHQ